MRSYHVITYVIQSPGKLIVPAWIETDPHDRDRLRAPRNGFVSGTPHRGISDDREPIDRLNAHVHAGSTDDGRWALELLMIYRDRLDWPYLREQARVDATAVALRKLEKTVSSRS